MANRGTRGTHAWMGSGPCRALCPLPSEELGAVVLLGTKTHIFIDSFAILEPGKFQAPRLSRLFCSPSLPVLWFPWQQPEPAPDAEAGEGSWGKELLTPHQPGRLGREETFKGTDISPTVHALFKKCFMVVKHTRDKIYHFHRF